MQQRGFHATAIVLIAVLLAACGGSTTSQGPTTVPGGASAPSDPGPDIGRISILGPFSGGEAAAFEEVIRVFEAANPGIDVVYTGVGDFDTQIIVKVQAGDPPDIAAFPQPGGAARLARDGQLVPLWPEAQATLDKNFAPFWKQLGTFEGQPYGMFHRVNAKGWIWYNKPAFEQAGYSVPKTWDELISLTEKMEASGRSPWCEGMESGQATGWKGTDWIENIMLRTQPVETYDEWSAGRLPFSSPEVKNAFDILGRIWLDPKAVYGGQPTIVLTRVADAATFLFDNPPHCWLHMQGSFVTGFFPDNVKQNIDSQVGVFMMPQIDPNLPPALEVGGDVYTVMRGKDRPEVRKFIEFLGTPEATTPWIKQGGALFAHQGQDLSAYPTEIERTMAETLVNAQVARFDGSDAMPAAVNAAFWKGLTDWVSGSRDLEGALQDIDDARTQ